MILLQASSNAALVEAQVYARCSIVRKGRLLVLATDSVPKILKIVKRHPYILPSSL